MVIFKSTAQKIKFSIEDFFSKQDQIHRKLRIWSYLVKKSLMENFIFLQWSWQKKFKGDLKLKLYGKRLQPIESVKHLGVKFDTNLSWQYYVNDLFIKLNRANALLFKMRRCVSLEISKSIYF